MLIQSQPANPYEFKYFETQFYQSGCPDNGDAHHHPSQRAK